MLPPEIGAVMGIQIFSCIKIGLWGEKFIFKAVFSFFFFFLFLSFSFFYRSVCISCYFLLFDVHKCISCLCELNPTLLTVKKYWLNSPCDFPAKTSLVGPKCFVYAGFKYD